MWQSKPHLCNYFIKLNASGITNTIRMIRQEKFTTQCVYLSNKYMILYQVWLFFLLMHHGFPECFRFHQNCLQLHFLENFSKFQVGVFLKTEGKNFKVEVCTSRQENTTFFACIKYKYVFNFNLYLHIKIISVSSYSSKSERQNTQKRPSDQNLNIVFTHLPSRTPVGNKPMQLYYKNPITYIQLFRTYPVVLNQALQLNSL